MKNIILLFLLVAFSFSALAKKDSLATNKDYGNYLFISLLGHDFPKTYEHQRRLSRITRGNIADVFSIFYERKIYKNLRIGGGYATWNPFPALYRNVFSEEGEVIVNGPLTGRIIQRGTIETIQQYKMADVYLCYRYNRFKRHKITVGVGMSYTWGINQVVDSIHITPYEYTLFDHYETANYYGIIARISYDYLCLHNRLAIGYEFKWRKYFGLYSPQIEYGFHVGVNF